MPLVDELQGDGPAGRGLPVALDGLDGPLHGLVHGLKIPHLLVDLVVALNEFLLDEDDVLLLQQGLDLGQAHAEILQVADDIQPRGLADVIVPVVGLRVPVAGLQKPHPVIEPERGDGDVVRLRHLADRQQVVSDTAVHSGRSLRSIFHTQYTRNSAPKIEFCMDFFVKFPELGTAAQGRWDRCRQQKPPGRTRGSAPR